LGIEVARVYITKSGEESDFPGSGVLVWNARNKIVSSHDGMVRREEVKFYNITDAGVEVVGAKFIL
jgi:hypothetical protein